LAQTRSSKAEEHVKEANKKHRSGSSINL